MAAAVASVVVLVLGVLFVTGFFTPASSGGVGDGTPASFSSAIAVAAAIGTSTTGGPWTIVGAEGIGIPGGLEAPNGEYVGSGGCTFTPVPGGSEEVTIFGTPSNAAPGTVATWVFFEKNASGNVILMNAVSNGDANPLVLVSGCGGVSTFEGASAISASTDVDSITVAATFDNEGGSQFLANHTGATQLFVLVGATSGAFSAWLVEYSSCAYTAAGGNGTSLTGTFYGSNGAVLTSPSSGAC